MSKLTAPLTPPDMERLRPYLGGARPPHWIRPAFEYWDGTRWLTDREAREAAEKATKTLT
jgi:hypothetical protein